MTDPDGNVTSYVYDSLNRQIETINPLHFASSEYDLDGNVVQTTDFDGHTIQYAYDADGNKIEEDWLDGNGNIIHATKTYYNTDGHVYAVVNPSASYYYQYNQDGQVVRSRMVPGDLTSTHVAVLDQLLVRTGRICPTEETTPPLTRPPRWTSARC